MTNTMSVAVVGASGFIGSATVRELRSIGCHVTEVRAPRLSDSAGADPDIEVADISTRRLRNELAGCRAVINCAGDPDASSRNVGRLIAANGLLPGVVGRAARDAGVSRFVHVSSAVVQGRVATLDSSDQVEGFSAYSRSKILGEEMARAFGPEETVVYRPPSVHATDRRISRLIARFARSPLSTVAAPGTQHTPQAHIDNVASALAFLAVCSGPVPPRVHHPWEGHTTAGLLEVMGAGRCPRAIPPRLARAMTAALAGAGRIVPAIAPNSRRLELVWFGQEQAASWLTESGWQPPAGLEAWRMIEPGYRDGV